MPDLERTALECRGKAYHERPDHCVVLLGVLMLDEELPGRIDQHRVQLRSQRAAAGQAEVVPKAIEQRVERAIPPALVDLHAALRDLPRVSDPPIQKGPLSAPVPRRPRQYAQLFRLRLGHRKLDRPDTPHLELQVARRGGPRRAERLRIGRAGQQGGKAVAGRVAHRAGKSRSAGPRCPAVAASSVVSSQVMAGLATEQPAVT